MRPTEKTDMVTREQCYRLYFDFSDFEEHNAKYFKAVYLPNVYTKELENKTGRKKFTAIEAGRYNPKYDAYFSFEGLVTRDDRAFQREIVEYLQVVFEAVDNKLD